MQIGAREGQFVTPETELYMIADLSKVWVYAEIYEYELPWVKVGDPVEMQLAGIPGRIFNGHLAFIYPYAEAKTRTIHRVMPDLAGLAGVLHQPEWLKQAEWMEQARNAAFVELPGSPRHLVRAARACSLLIPA